jgi:hypothetical protein
MASVGSKTYHNEKLDDNIKIEGKMKAAGVGMRHWKNAEPHSASSPKRLRINRRGESPFRCVARPGCCRLNPHPLSETS